MEAICDAVCPACLDNIDIGDEITYDEALGAWVHTGCVEPDDNEGETAA